MRQGITTRYLGPTHTKESRIQAVARKGNRNRETPEIALIMPYDHEGTSDSRHATVAQALATNLGWSGLWIAGGKPEEDGNMYVNAGKANWAVDKWPEGVEGADWFYVAEEVKA